MNMVQDGHQSKSETKTPIGKHVCVDYSGGTFGDFLRYLISLHDGFEKFEKYGWKENLPHHPELLQQFPNFPLHPNKKIDLIKTHSGVFFQKPIKQLGFENANTIDKFNSEFDRLMPNNKKYRQVYKTLSEVNKNAGKSHSFANATWLEDGSIIDGVPFKWNYHDYNTVRQTDHKIIFVSLSPFSKYKDIYLDRHKKWDDLYGREYNTKKHLEVWTKNYLNNIFPKHELNYEIEINELLDGHEDTYIDLCKFIDVKPLDNWRDYIDEFQRHIFPK
tara:strand:+ start:828 stop:1652 length:825 start_codon:yes stop_codon:yes gene_type:complete